MLVLDHLEQSPILKSVDASFDHGRVIGLIGPNGAGKSTLLRTIAGTLPPTAGHVYVNGNDLTAQNAKTRARHIAYLPQSLPDDIPYTVREFVEMGRYSHGLTWFSRDDGEQVRQAISELALEALQDAPLNAISGGERQRAGLAKCLAQESQVLVLDEPISNLDIYYQLDIMTRLRQLAAQGRLILIAIHHLEFALRFCDELIVLCQGEVYRKGPVNEVFSEEMVQEVFGIDATLFRDPIHHHPRLSMNQMAPGSSMATMAKEVPSS